jgi:hypothetical protein
MFDIVILYAKSVILNYIVKNELFRNVFLKNCDLKT